MRLVDEIRCAHEMAAYKGNDWYSRDNVRFLCIYLCFLRDILRGSHISGRMRWPHLMGMIGILERYMTFLCIYLCFLRDILRGSHISGRIRCAHLMGMIGILERYMTFLCIYLCFLRDILVVRILVAA
jgi:hypothetical protein